MFRVLFCACGSIWKYPISLQLCDTVKETIIEPRKYVPNIACRAAQYVLDPIPNFEENVRFFSNIGRRKIPNILQIFFLASKNQIIFFQIFEFAKNDFHIFPSGKSKSYFQNRKSKVENRKSKFFLIHRTRRFLFSEGFWVHFLTSGGSKNFSISDTGGQAGPPKGPPCKEQ